MDFHGARGDAELVGGVKAPFATSDATKDPFTPHPACPSATRVIPNMSAHAVLFRLC